ncbi:MAG: outer membrane lipoprotein-sorting protein [Candidatus Thiodiazotropha sp. (ex Lucinoma kastoroae)]|nr:outer membrane lipoprotein-sorting protein [Candidatus Thiodiazotropha sp. (ex Lucinoma kastoroae)]
MTVIMTLILGVVMITAAQGTEHGSNNKGFDIAAHSDHSDSGFSDSKVELKMILHNAVGTETTRSMSIRTLEILNDDLGDRSLIVFESPADVSGTALLSHARILDPDDQWLFLPALKRTKRISSVNKSGPFMGSEFAFEDLTSEELYKFEYKFLRSEPCGDLVCDVVERTPRYAHSGYKRQIAWFDQAIHQLRKVEFYDRRDEVSKVMTVEDYRQYQDKYWRAHNYSMVNVKTKKSTDLIYGDYQFKSGLNKRDFERVALRRVR